MTIRQRVIRFTIFIAAAMLFGAGCSEPVRDGSGQVETEATTGADTPSEPDGTASAGPNAAPGGQVASLPAPGSSHLPNGALAPADGSSGVPLPGARPPEAVPGASTPEDAARGYLRRHARELGLNDFVIDEAVVERVHDIGRGAIVVRMAQSLGGLEVFGTRLAVVMTRDLEVVGTTGSLNPYATRRLWRGASFEVTEPGALTAAFGDMHGARGLALDPSLVTQTDAVQGPYRFFDVDWSHPSTSTRSSRSGPSGCSSRSRTA